MLPGCLGSMFEYPRLSRIDDDGEGTADLAKDLHWRDVECPLVSVLKQRRESLTRVVVGDCTAKRAPQPFDTVGLWIVSGGVHEHELTAQLGEQLAEQQ